MLLTANRSAMKLMFGRFEIWIKLFYFMQYMISAFVYDFVLRINDDIHEDWERPNPGTHILTYFKISTTNQNKWRHITHSYVIYNM